MSTDARTIQTYDESAEKIATHFEQYKDGVAREEIYKAFTLAAHPVDRVIEIGCGAGKDASELVRRAKHYEGFDPSNKLLAIARSKMPKTSFVQADALTYAYPANVDIVFAFASLLHLPKDDFAEVCYKISSIQKPGGVFCMTLKEADTYIEQLQEDQFGIRLFYLYPPTLIQELVDPSYKLAFESHTTSGPKAKKWMSLIFVKQ